MLHGLSHVNELLVGVMTVWNLKMLAASRNFCIEIHLRSLLRLYYTIRAQVFSLIHLSS